MVNRIGLLAALTIATLIGGAMSGVPRTAHAANYDQCLEGRSGFSYRRCLKDVEHAFRLCQWTTGQELRCRMQLTRRNAGCRQRYCVIRAPVTRR
ncbi:MAG: hypothetical protein KDJ37_06735 [Hyphomicrobiaceae bacterium]|nr:hypothetical protein [Hyphomicrobiaceae bacterium]